MGFVGTLEPLICCSSRQQPGCWNNEKRIRLCKSSVTLEDNEYL